MLLEARYSSNPPGDRVLNNRTMEVEVARRDFWTNENPDPSKWKDVSSAWGLRGGETDRRRDRQVEVRPLDLLSLRNGIQNFHWKSADLMFRGVGSVVVIQLRLYLLKQPPHTPSLLS